MELFIRIIAIISSFNNIHNIMKGQAVTPAPNDND